jgi:hypothetical protein
LTGAFVNVVLLVLRAAMRGGHRSWGIILTMKSKRLAHWRTVSMEGGRSRANRLSLASLRSWVRVKVGLRTLPTLLPRPSNAWRTRARNRCLWQGCTSGGPRLAAIIRQAPT